ncbi:glycosyltransferase family 4 protein [Vagococcus fluvialis]|uniref:glycosyltransferase family 4 protein n=1 Tax=Vagococcus fluvialis TaxID=2738 RepID=UPI0020340290|nr:glycosyltransferase family 4 protein [Vagococcus fluvialis]MCM2138014.1 glycosyltransferase family 4 protein [Vagococcus fluvialis]
MKKVLIVSSVASMIDQFNKDNIKVLQDLGYEVHVATNFDNPGTITNERATQLKNYLTEEKVTFFHVDFDRNPLNVLEFKTAYNQLNTIAENNSYSFVHLHSPIGGIIGRIVFRKREAKIIYTAHGFHFFKGAPLKNWLIYYPIEKFFSKYTDVLLTINSEDYEISKKKLKAKKVEFINGVGVDSKKFNKIDDLEKKKLKVKNMFNESDFLMIYVGELSYRKNQLNLIEAMKKIDAEEVKLLLVGQGDDEKMLKDYVNKSNLNKQVKFLGYRTDISDLMGMTDIVVSSSRQEGLPVNLIEGMCKGKPLVVTNCRGNRDLVQDRINGYTVPIDEPERFATKILELKNHESILESFSESSLELSKTYDLKMISKEMRKIYKNME